LDDKESLEYQRPLSLEEAPSAKSYFERRDDESRPPREMRQPSVVPAKELHQKKV